MNASSSSEDEDELHGRASRRNRTRTHSVISSDDEGDGEGIQDGVEKRALARALEQGMMPCGEIRYLTKGPKNISGSDNIPWGRHLAECHVCENYFTKARVAYLPRSKKPRGGVSTVPPLAPAAAAVAPAEDDAPPPVALIAPKVCGAASLMVARSMYLIKESGHLDVWGDWRKVNNPNAAKPQYATYWYHLTTKETQWTHPETDHQEKQHAQVEGDYSCSFDTALSTALANVAAAAAAAAIAATTTEPLAALAVVANDPAGAAAVPTDELASSGADIPSAVDEDSANANPNVADYSIGDRVEVRWQAEVFNAIVLHVHSPGKVDVVYDVDGSIGLYLTREEHGLKVLLEECVFDGCQNKSAADGIRTQGLCFQHGAYGCCTTHACLSNAITTRRKCNEHDSETDAWCSIEGCSSIVARRGLCENHGGTELCSFNRCLNAVPCGKHIQLASLPGKKKPQGRPRGRAPRHPTSSNRKILKIFKKGTDGTGKDESKQFISYRTAMDYLGIQGYSTFYKCIREQIPFNGWLLVHCNENDLEMADAAVAPPELTMPSPAVSAAAITVPNNDPTWPQSVASKLFSAMMAVTRS